MIGPRLPRRPIKGAMAKRRATPNPPAPAFFIDARGAEEAELARLAAAIRKLHERYGRPWP